MFSYNHMKFRVKLINRTGIPPKINQHLYDNGEEEYTYHLRCSVEVKMKLDNGIECVISDVNTIRHLTDCTSTPLHNIYFLKDDNDRFYLECSDEQLGECSFLLL